jgi:hypothetical protein
MQRKTTIYMAAATDKILGRLMEESGESQSAIVNSAVIFYAERGAYMADLIKTSIREALSE